MQAQTERNEEILRLREEGKTFREIAERCGITVSRAQQIYEKQRRIRDGFIKLADKPGPKKGWKQQFTVRSGGGPVFITRIVEGEKGAPPMYVYETDDIAQAMRFTEEEARKIAKRCRGIVCMIMEGR